MYAYYSIHFISSSLFPCHTSRDVPVSDVPSVEKIRIFKNKTKYMTSCSTIVYRRRYRAVLSSPCLLNNRFLPHNINAHPCKRRPAFSSLCFHQRGRQTIHLLAAGPKKIHSFFRGCFFAACSLHAVSSESRSLVNLKNKYLAVHDTQHPAEPVICLPLSPPLNATCCSANF